MSKTETLRQSAAASNATRLEQLAGQIETVRQAKLQSAQELAEILEPLAQAMAALTDETRQTLAEIDRRSQEQAEKFSRQLSTAAQTWRKTAVETQKAADSLNQAGAWIEWRHYALVLTTAMLTAVLVSVFWLWLAPPTVENQLDSKAVAEHLKPAVIEVLKPSNGR